MQNLFANGSEMLKRSALHTERIPWDGRCLVVGDFPGFDMLMTRSSPPEMSGDAGKDARAVPVIQ